MDPQLTPLALRKLRRSLLAWYDAKRRELPWRHDADPYRVWLSEIMLQQTRVAAVIDHYGRFLQKFPNVRTLAAAREASVLAAWSGLGYYHRARRMHQAAKVIARKRKGVFPRTAEEWRALPGVGRYTAAAIASISFGEAIAVVDGNVERVVDRVFAAAQGREAAWQRAELLLDHGRPGDFNQAMMELGATLCTPRAPQCPICPLRKWCASRGARHAAPQPTRKRKHLAYGLACDNGSILLVKRPANASLMAGMWELPSVSNAHRNGDQPLATLRHSITDTDYRVSVFTVPARNFHRSNDNARWFTRRQWERLPLTGLARKILRRLPA
ncbi:MAG: A/G-specific adenine glycosylase [Candidatus Korobacteraceae bacterium]